MQEPMNRRLFFSVGEPSGDLHASNLIRALRKQDDSLQCRGFGGVKMMQSGGFECDFDLTQMAVVGFAEVVPKLREFFRIADIASDIFQRGEVDGVVLVDFPGFNWHIAKRAKKHGLPVFYYLPPQLWAWGGWRIKKIKAHVDHVLCNLPFEHEWYLKQGVAAEWVGHPFFDEVTSRHLDARFLQCWTKPNALQVAVLPGSRDHEVHQLWPMQLTILQNLHRRFPEVRFLVGAYKDAHALWCKQQLQQFDPTLPVEIFVGKTSEILEICDCALMKSGSVSLELMARGVPATVLYRVSRLTYAIGKLLTQCKSFTLPNLIAGETVMPEYLSVGNPAKAIAGAIESMSQLIGDADYRAAARNKLLQMRDEYAQPGASRKAASFILQKMPNPYVRSTPRVVAA